MKKNKLIVTIASTLIASNLVSVGVFAKENTENPKNEEKSIINEENNSKEIITDKEIMTIKKSVTTGGAVEVDPDDTATDIPESILTEYDSFFEDNPNIKSISDIIDRIYESIDGINLESNPNFSSLSKGKVANNILLSILDLDEYKNNDSDIYWDMKSATQIYELYRELSTPGGFIYKAKIMYEKYDNMAEQIEDFTIKYNYKLTDTLKFKEDLENNISSEKINLIYDNDFTKIIVPTEDSTGYVYIAADVDVEGSKVLSFEFETVLPKLKSDVDVTDEIVNKENLKTLYDTYINMIQGKYTNSSWTILKNELNNATTVINNENATQDEVDKAYSTLKLAIDGLVKKKSSSSSSGSSSKNNSTDNNEIKEEAKEDTKVDTAINIMIENGTIKLTNSDGQTLTGWQQVNGKWYLGNQDGEALTGWQQVNGEWYHLNTSGTMETGWLNDSNGRWYYLKSDGSMATNWVKNQDGKWYHLNVSGNMETGWLKDQDNKWYYLDNSGVMKTGWLKNQDNKWYYLNNDGSMASNTTIDGYNLDSDGALID